MAPDRHGGGPDNGFYSQNWTFAEHTATHIDAPSGGPCRVLAL